MTLISISITMLKTINGSPDGTFVRTYHEGQSYNVPQVLADTFVDSLSCAVRNDDRNPASDIKKARKKTSKIKKVED